MSSTGTEYTAVYTDDGSGKIRLDEGLFKRNQQALCRSTPTWRLHDQDMAERLDALRVA